MLVNENGVMKKSASIQYIYNTLGKISKKEVETKHSYSLTQYDAQRFAKEDLGIRCKNKREARIYLQAIEAQVAAMIED